MENQRKYQFEQRIEKRKHTHGKRKERKGKTANQVQRMLHMCTMSFFLPKKRKDKAATISAPDETHRLERTKDAIIIIKPYHISSLCIQSLPFGHASSMLWANERVRFL